MQRTNFRCSGVGALEVARIILGCGLDNPLKDPGGWGPFHMDRMVAMARDQGDPCRAGVQGNVHPHSRPCPLWGDCRRRIQPNVKFQAPPAKGANPRRLKIAAKFQGSVLDYSQVAVDGPRRWLPNFLVPTVHLSRGSRQQVGVLSPTHWSGPSKNDLGLGPVGPPHPLAEVKWLSVAESYGIRVQTISPPL